jgi:hypothetical protein
MLGFRLYFILSKLLGKFQRRKTSNEFLSNLRYGYFIILKLNNYFRQKAKNTPEIDLVIPLHLKDINLIETVVLAAKLNSINPIRNVFIVSKQDRNIQILCRKNNYNFINEDSLSQLPSKKQINYSFHGQDRSGWLFQQLIKLSIDNISQQRFILVLDADTILTKKQKFVDNGKLYLNCSDEFHVPYYKVVKKILKVRKTFPVSFISHYMIFDKNILDEMKKEIECLHDKKWIDVILENLDRNSISGFSEYELWGNYLIKNHCRQLYLSYWKNKSLIQHEKNLSSLLVDYRNYKSVSIHNYNLKH